VIALPARTQEPLEQWHEESPFKDADDLIFYGMAADRSLNVKTVTDLFPSTIQRLNESSEKDGLPPAVPMEGRNLVAHSLRHTYNTIMKQVLPEEILRMFTGHKTPEMTEHYDHPALMDQIKKLEPSRKIVEKVWK
jgi:integrase